MNSATVIYQLRSLQYEDTVLKYHFCNTLNSQIGTLFALAATVTMVLV